MAGMLDFQNSAFSPQNLTQLGSLGSVTEDGGPIYGYDDYVGDIPIKRPKRADEVENAALGKFQEAHPLTPQVAAASAPPMAPGAPIPGMLGGEFGGPYGAVPSAAPQPGSVPLPKPAPPPGLQATPPSAQPTGGTPPPGTPPVPAPPRPRSADPTEGAADLREADPNIVGKIWKGIQDNSGLLLGLGAGLSGAPSWAVGAGRGFAGAAAGQQADFKQNLLGQSNQQLYTALVGAGVPRQQAIAATTNPELAKRLMDEYIITRKSDIKVLKDSLGNERLVATNPYMSQEEIERANNAGAGGAAGGAAGLGQLATMPIQIDPNTGRDENFASAFKQADPVNYTATMDLLEGNMSGAGRNLQALMKYASRIDPNFNTVTYGGRNALYKSYYGGGEGFKQLRSANTTIDHGIQLSKAIDNLNNFTVLPDFLNASTGKVSEQYSKAYQKALGDFEAARGVYAHELEFALTGKNTVSGTKENEALFDKYASPVKLHSALQSTLEKLEQRVGEHEAAYNRGMGGKASKNPVTDMLTNRDKLDQLLHGGGAEAPAAASSAAAASAPTATGPNGHKIVVKNGRWVDMQTGQPVQ